MSWQIIIIVVLGGFLLLIPLMSYLSSRRMIGKTVAGDRFGGKDGLLYFYNENCGPCRRMTPIIDQLSKEHDRVSKVNISSDPETANDFGVTATPTTILIKGHIIKEVLLGTRTQKQLERLLAELD